MDRTLAINKLIEQTKDLSCWRENFCGSNIVESDENKRIPPYIPQIGLKYFEANNHPKILMYAMNANIKKHMVSETINESKGKENNWIYSRLNEEKNNKPTIDTHIGPYPHMNMLARLLYFTLTNDIIGYDECVKKTAATNLIKCSTTTGPSTPNIIMYGNCAQNTCKYEIELLEPKIIIAIGSSVFYSLVHALGYIPDESGFFAKLPKENNDNQTPKIIIYSYHSTGPIISHFKSLEKYFGENSGSRPKAYKPYFKMLLGVNFDKYPEQEMWDRARTVYNENKEILLEKYLNKPNKQEEECTKPGYRFYFACHFGLFNIVKNKLFKEE